VIVAAALTVKTVIVFVELISMICPSAGAPGKSTDADAMIPAGLRIKI
jgi:hypothetical protein